MINKIPLFLNKIIIKTNFHNLKSRTNMLYKSNNKNNSNKNINNKRKYKRMKKKILICPILVILMMNISQIPWIMFTKTLIIPI